MKVLFTGFIISCSPGCSVFLVPFWSIILHGVNELFAQSIISVLVMYIFTPFVIIGIVIIMRQMIKFIIINFLFMVYFI